MLKHSGDGKELVGEDHLRMTYYVSSGTVNPTHLLTLGEEKPTKDYIHLVAAPHMHHGIMLNTVKEFHF